ncbi:pantoate--beta-alanine ligase [Paenibacillus agricola]|uniref:Pantothenate synthetase n=1 Tax=Paenibacillus agricola TaxID=2716264 RepID=A0ABX0IXL5_9BACL|nr:pantoate--beta-alanine ligase [Paenibacillus agricola]NHN28687.1 pantoate--beta-alanine ligase [Paenibacillus agricola]
MQVIHHIEELRAVLKGVRAKQPGFTIGFVPTMGFLHQGHASLLQQARKQCDFVVLSIFVNPLQFGPNEDFDRYPRNEARDLELAEEEGTDVVFCPSTVEMYPKPVRTKISLSIITEQLCGASRPGHFDGVAVIVTKLFQIIQPDAAFFGLKDVQQVAVIKQLVDDLNMPLQIVPCPIVREQDGLAMSSRNVYLQPEERRQALALSSALKLAEQRINEAADVLLADELKQMIRTHIAQMPLAEIEYVEIVTYPELEPVSRLQRSISGEIVIALAARFGKTRLIDNTIILLSK